MGIDLILPMVIHTYYCTRVALSFISVVLLSFKNQRTSGPVNAPLTPGPGTYFNAFIHVYSPRAGADNPLGTKALSQCPFVASFKKTIFEV